jgi:hypothetical protein
VSKFYLVVMHPLTWDFVMRLVTLELAYTQVGSH